MTRFSEWSRDWRCPLVALALMLVTLGLLELSARPPAPLPATAAESRFAAGRAQEILARLVGDSSGHPTGTARNASVRQRVADELAALGLPVEMQAAFACQPRWAVCAEVTNVMTRWPGTSDGPAVLLTAHYDSVAAGPGAGDDLSGVAVLLEVARILSQEPPLPAPIMLLFTDGEEIALLGAQVFMDEHPWAADVGVVVNLEANGTGGQSILFETTRRSGWLTETLSGAAPRLTGNAFADSLYTLFPFNSDLTVYEAAGIPGVNFAFVERHALYHTPLDAPVNIDPGSLQHHGENALAAARAFANEDLRNPPTGERVYADLAPGVFVTWPWGWTLGIALALAAGWLSVTTLAIRRGDVLGREVLWGMGLLPAVVPLATLAGLALGMLVQASSGAPAPWYAHPLPLQVVLWIAALLITGSLASLIRRRAGLAGLFYGTWLAWTLLGVGIAATWPAASFTVFAPVALALGLAAGLQGPVIRRRPWAPAAASGLGLVGACWMWLWFARGSDFLALSPEFPATAAFALALSATGGASLLAAPGTGRQAASVLGGGLALLAGAAFLLGAVVPTYAPGSPQPLNVLRIEDRAAAQVVWALEAEGRSPESMVAVRAFGVEPAQAVPWLARAVHVAPAGGGITVDGPAHEIRRESGAPLRLPLPTAPPGSHVAVYIPEEVEVQAFRLTRGGEEQVLPAPPVHDGYSRFLCLAPACDGATLALDLKGEAPFTAFISQTWLGLPAADSDLIAARPPWATPRHTGDATVLVDRIAVTPE
ncbi:MAG: M20/M25/M40 family metallo-hydrolase [Thermomicrobiales bacterium]|nr:M20/M25/M40 family metallo-hydrolase [Thermomicrobiales bacterium]